MSRMRISLTVSAALLSGTAYADVPNVAVDIAPVHSLVARVMQGVGEPNLVIQQGASPHEYNLRPSEAAALQNADLVFWIGEDLTPWLDDAVETLATKARVTALLEAEGTELLDFREGALFEAHEHGDHDDHGDDDHEDHDTHGDEDHDDHDHDHDHDDENHEDHGHNDHDDHENHGGHSGHDHGDHDPHAWLSPENARSWLNVIAAELSTQDPDNAGTYFANASAARDELDELIGDVSATLAPVRGQSFVVFHDAYQYFETAFDIPASGAISVSDATDPSPARLDEIQGRIRDENVACVLSEPQFNAGLVETVLDGTSAKTGVIDPIGADLEAGPNLYAGLIRNMADTLKSCLSE